MSLVALKCGGGLVDGCCLVFLLQMCTEIKFDDDSAAVAVAAAAIRMAQCTSQSFWSLPKFPTAAQ